jgi:hypothetical protein
MMSLVGGSKVRSRCRKCETRSQTERIRARDPIKRESISRKRREAEKTLRIRRPDYWMIRSLRISVSRLGLNFEEILEAFDHNGNKCEACGWVGSGEIRGRVYIDHDHATGLFRGFLCSPCNLMAGISKDQEDRLLLVAEYLRSRPSEKILAGALAL